MAEYDLAYGSSAVGAGFTFPAVDVQFVSEIAGLPVAADRSIHQVWLDRDAPAATYGMQVCAGERVGQRFGAEAREQRVSVWVFLGPEQAAEAARIVEAQDAARIELEINVIVFSGCGAAFGKPHAAGHAEVGDQCAGVGSEQQVLGPAIDRMDDASGQAVFEAPVSSGERPRRVVSTSGNSGIRAASRSRTAQRILVC